MGFQLQGHPATLGEISTLAGDSTQSHAESAAPQGPTLASLSPGQSAQVAKVHACGALGLRLHEMGLVPGTWVRLVRRAPMGDPLQFEVRGYQLSLRAKDAGRIAIHPIDA